MLVSRPRVVARGDVRDGRGRPFDKLRAGVRWGRDRRWGMTVTWVAADTLVPYRLRQTSPSLSKGLPTELDGKSPEPSLFSVCMAGDLSQSSARMPEEIYSEGKFLFGHGR